MSRTSRKLLPLAVAVAAAQATTVNAQQLEEVIVTAQKRVESLQDTPLSVVAYSDGPGQGARFRIRLPAMAKEKVPA